MDIGLPSMDGIQAAKEIRKLGAKGKEIPIIALTANASAELKEQCLQAGMNDHIQKPLTVDKAESCLKKYLNI